MLLVLLFAFALLLESWFQLCLYEKLGGVERSREKAKLHGRQEITQKAKKIRWEGNTRVLFHTLWAYHHLYYLHRWRRRRPCLLASSVGGMCYTSDSFWHVHSFAFLLFAPGIQNLLRGESLDNELFGQWWLFFFFFQLTSMKLFTKTSLNQGYIVLSNQEYRI